MTNKDMKSRTSFILKIFYVSLAFILAVVASVVVLSAFNLPNGLKLYTVMSGSMEPAVSTGSVVAVKKAKDYNMGDIITFRNGSLTNINKEYTITHRISEITEQGGDARYTTRGDANSTEDSLPVFKNQVLGRVIFVIPHIGYLVSFTKTELGFVLYIVIPATLIIYSEVSSIKRELLRLINKKKKENQSNSDGVKELPL
jgi:signal peptidase